MRWCGGRFSVSPVHAHFCPGACNQGPTPTSSLILITPAFPSDLTDFPPSLKQMCSKLWETNLTPASGPLHYCSLCLLHYCACPPLRSHSGLSSNIMSSEKPSLTFHADYQFPSRSMLFPYGLHILITLKAPNTIILGARFSTYELGEDTNVHSIAFPIENTWEWVSMLGSPVWPYNP